jgi:hypothetical protein
MDNKNFEGIRSCEKDLYERTRSDRVELCALQEDARERQMGLCRQSVQTECLQSMQDAMSEGAGDQR